MENEGLEIQKTNIYEENSLENTEEFTENNEQQNIENNEITNNTEGYILDNNDNSSPVVYSSEIFTLEENQYKSFIDNLNLLNNLAIIQVMFLFLLFIYLFIHFCTERRKS